MSNITSCFIDFATHTNSEKEYDSKGYEKIKNFKGWNSQFDIELKEDIKNRFVFTRTGDICTCIWIEVCELEKELTVQAFHKIFKKITIGPDEGSDIIATYTPETLDFIYNFMDSSKKEIYKKAVKSGCLILPLDLHIPMCIIPFINIYLTIETEKEELKFKCFTKYTILNNEDRKDMINIKNLSYTEYETCIYDLKYLDNPFYNIECGGFMKDIMYAVRDKNTGRYLSNLIDEFTLQYESTYRFSNNSKLGSIINPFYYNKGCGSDSIFLYSYGDNDFSYPNFDKLANVSAHFKLNKKELGNYSLEKLVLYGLRDKSNLFNYFLFNRVSDPFLINEIESFGLNHTQDIKEVENQNLQLVIVFVKKSIISFVNGIYTVL